MQKALIICTIILMSGCSISQPTQPIFEYEGQTFDVYFYIPEDNGINGELIGCGDSLSPMQNTIYTNADPLRSAINALLTVEPDIIRSFGLDSAFIESSLSIGYIQDKNTYSIIALEGDIFIQSDCDKSRIQGQLLRTAGQFFPNNNFIILINDQPLQEI